MKLLIIDNAEPRDYSYNEPLINAASQFVDLDVLNYRELINMQYVDIAAYGGIVISGVPINYAFDSLEKRLPHLQLLKDLDLPVLGICLGHQALGRMHDAKIIRNKEAEDGLQPISIVQDDPIFQDIESGQHIIASHRASISLPNSFVLLASTPMCRNQIMKHAERPIYGIQFHPEFSLAGARFLRNFAALAKNRWTEPLLSAESAMIIA